MQGKVKCSRKIRTFQEMLEALGKVGNLKNFFFLNQEYQESQVQDKNDTLWKVGNFQEKFETLGKVENIWKSRKCQEKQETLGIVWNFQEKQETLRKVKY